MENNIELDIDDLFKDPVEDTGPAANDNQDNKSPDTDKSRDEEDMTKAVSNRINSVKQKTETETQDRVARELGYKDYVELQANREKKILEEAGLDKDDADISAVIDKLVEKRLANDSRFKKLEEFELSERNSFVASQLNEINKATGNNFASIDQLPKETLKVWEKIGDLKQAYYATQGETLLSKVESKQQNGSLAHLGEQSAQSTGQKARGLTKQEKAIWRSVFPDITDEELSKKTVDIE